MSINKVPKYPSELNQAICYLCESFLGTIFDKF